MEKELVTYFDFAEDDYQYLLEDYNNGRVANYMGASSQNTCERYLKYIIEEMFYPQTESEEDNKVNILKKHNLRTLVKFLRKNNLCDFSKDEIAAINAVNGFYYTTRYPGDDSISVDKEDIDDCMEALNICRNKALEIKLQLTQDVELNVDMER